MLVSLVNAQSGHEFVDAVEWVRSSYCKGTYTAKGKDLQLPFGKQFEELFKEPKNEGTLNHVVNVVTAMAHVLVYLEKHGDEVLFGSFDVRRRLGLMLLAFYHDIGKCVVFRRHAVEGRALFAEPKASILYRFELIYKAYGLDLPHETLPFFAELIGAHDVFGTVSTGENGLLSLSGVVGRLKDLYNGDKQAVKDAVLDLWLLNCADILVSVPRLNKNEVDKSKPQKWCETPPGTLDAGLDWFFASIKGTYLKEDLGFALDIAEAVCDGADAYGYAKALSEKRAAHRFARLARSALGDVLEKPETRFCPLLKDEIVQRLESPAIIPTINMILRDTFGEGHQKLFGAMLQFDYALGFFSTLAERAVYWLNEELEEKSFRTGWIYKRKIPQENDTQYAGDFLLRYNAECVVNNYMAILARVFGAIHRQTAEIERWNIEFEDAKNRMTWPKANRLLGFNGPYRAENALCLLMRELMLYKA